MSINFCIRLSDAEAQAVLRSEGFTNGPGIIRSKPLLSAEKKLIDIIQQRWNEQCEMRVRRFDD